MRISLAITGSQLWQTSKSSQLSAAAVQATKGGSFWVLGKASHSAIQVGLKLKSKVCSKVSFGRGHLCLGLLSTEITYVHHYALLKLWHFTIYQNSEQSWKFCHQIKYNGEKLRTKEIVLSDTGFRKTKAQDIQVLCGSHTESNNKTTEVKLC